ncbi:MULTISPECIES: three component ABC system middle component [unclassified Pseudomonas]|uniref:three component ABC system middle component n=1 Tax=unclassified Pseudomonas TaxID=196821 RepID=UPI00131E7C45|nr:MULTISPECIES: three component ABC system middle component [unclassified Pseudomonas]
MSGTERQVQLSEAALVQNEALGAYVLWKFGLGFQERDSRAATLPLAFMVLPLVLHAPTLGMVLSTYKSSGLHLFAAKLGEQREELFAVHERALALRQLSLESLMRSEQSGLLRIDPTTATMWAIGPHDDMTAPSLSERIRRIGPASEKIGYWFADLSDQQIAHTLKVEF